MEKFPWGHPIQQKLSGWLVKGAMVPERTDMWRLRWGRSYRIVEKNGKKFGCYGIEYQRILKGLSQDEDMPDQSSVQFCRTGDFIEL